MPLDPILVDLLAQAAEVGRPPIQELSVEEVRAGMAGLTGLGAYPETRVPTEDRDVPGPAGGIPVRVYRPDSGSPLPVVVWFHGGGWVIGDIESHDSICQQLAARIPAVVVSIGYRLAPEHPFPAGLDDCEAATRWVHEHAGELGADPDRLAVAGDSAGGNLAALVCIRARRAGSPPIAFQLLVYPGVDLTCSAPSHQENGHGYLLEAESIAWFLAHYGADPRDPGAAPLLEPDLSDLPPALVITAEYDPLRDEGEEYAARLAEAGNDACAHRYEGMVHAFFGMNAILPAADAALSEAASALRAALTAPARPD